jgi:predicted CopG family antitoxin
MIKTQIQIEEWQYQALKKESVFHDRSMSDIIREALTVALKRKVPAHPLAKIAGKFSPLASDDLERHDALWVETIR